MYFTYAFHKIDLCNWSVDVVAGLEPSSPAGTTNIVKWHKNSLKAAKHVTIEISNRGSTLCTVCLWLFRYVQSESSCRRAVEPPPLQKSWLILSLGFSIWWHLTEMVSCFLFFCGFGGWRVWLCRREGCRKEGVLELFVLLLFIALVAPVCCKGQESLGPLISYYAVGWFTCTTLCFHCGDCSQILGFCLVKTNIV